MFKIFSSGLHCLRLFQLLLFICFCFSLSFSCWNVWSFKRKTSKVDQKGVTGSGLCCSVAWRKVDLFTGRVFYWTGQFFQEGILLFPLHQRIKKPPTLWKRREKTAVSLFCMQTFTWNLLIFTLFITCLSTAPSCSQTQIFSQLCQDKNCVLSSLSKRRDLVSSLLFALSIIFNLFMYFLIYFSSSSSKTPTHPVSEHFQHLAVPNSLLFVDSLPKA